MLGISVSANTVRALCVERGKIAWAGGATFEGCDDLTDVIASLTGECKVRCRRARVVLERDLVQLRTVQLAAGLSSREVRSYIALESPRLFRRNGGPLVTDAVLVKNDVGRRVVLAGAIQENVACAAVDGCRQGGITLKSLGCAAEVLAQALAQVPPSGDIPILRGKLSEVLSVTEAGMWRSRRLREPKSSDHEWAEPVAALGEPASEFAAAYGAALRAPRLSLLPSKSREAARRARTRRLTRLFAVALCVWLLAGAVYGFRLVRLAAGAERETAALAPDLDNALSVRRDLDLTERALGTITTAETGRSQVLALLAEVTSALGDSAFLVSLHLSSDSTLRLAGYATRAAQVLADLEQVRSLSEVRFETPITRETIASTETRLEFDRFAVAARVGGPS
jgi:hypothetical protein